MERMDGLLEFLIRSPLPDTEEEKDNMLKNILRGLSMSDLDSDFKRIFLLKIIQNHLSSQYINITEKLLKILEYLEELFRCDAFPVTTTISAAYCAVAVECTTKYLHLNLHHNPLYLGAVKRIWQVRVPHMNSSGSREGSLLYSVELERWKRDIETSLLDSQVRERLASIDTRGNAIIKLRAFLDEAYTVFDSPFAPLTVTEHTSTEHTATEHTNKAHRNQEREVQKRRLPATIEVKKKARQTVESDLSCSMDINDNSMDINDNEADQVKKNQRKKDQVEKAARVDEQDLVDGLQDGTSRFKLHSPKRRKHSPLKIYKPTAITKRRKVRRWSHLEEETLKNGVETFGRGNWKLILNAYKDIFEERTEVDLKDKWRNMMRNDCK